MLHFTRTAKYICFLGLAVFIIFNISSCKSSSSPVKFDGVYEHKGTDTFYYLRFYDDGSVISVSSTGTPEQIAKWFNKDYNDVSKGTYTVTGTHIKFSTTDSHGTVDYDGEIQNDHLALKSFSHINSFAGNEDYVFMEN